MSWSRLLFGEQSSTIKFVSFCELAPIVNLVKIASGKNSPTMTQINNYCEPICERLHRAQRGEAIFK